MVGEGERGVSHVSSVLVGGYSLCTRTDRAPGLSQSRNESCMAGTEHAREGVRGDKVSEEGTRYLTAL